MEEIYLPEYLDLEALKRELYKYNKKMAILISCTKRKLKYKAKAEKMYSKSPVFRKKLLLAQKIVPKEKIFVLSAKHGLISLEKEIEPYDLSMKQKNKEEKNQWGMKIVNQLEKIFGNQMNEHLFLVLAGRDYYEPLVKNEKLKKKILIFFPKNFGNGKRHQYLNKLLNIERKSKQKKS